MRDRLLSYFAGWITQACQTDNHGGCLAVKLAGECVICRSRCAERWRWAWRRCARGWPTPSPARRRKARWPPALIRRRWPMRCTRVAGRRRLAHQGDARQQPLVARWLNTEAAAVIAFSAIALTQQETLALTPPHLRCSIVNGLDDWSIGVLFSTPDPQKDASTACRPLLTPVQIGDITLNNRIVAGAADPAARAHEPGDVPNSALAAECHAQRADAGLLVAEARRFRQWAGLCRRAEDYNEAQVQAWQPITAAVHAKGGRMSLTAMACGPGVAHQLTAGARRPVASSAIAADANATVRNPDEPIGPGRARYRRALETAEIADLIEDYRQATDRSRRPALIWWRVHAAHGYLCTSFSRRWPINADQYGGSVENRARPTLEVVDAVIGEWDSAHVGIRISPLGIFNGTWTTPARKTSAWYLADRLAKRKLAYLHLSEPDWAGAPA